MTIPEMKRSEQVFYLFMLQPILPFSRVPLVQPETLQAGCGFTDPSGPLFSMYLDRAEGQDKKMADRWKADADGILTFVSGHISCLSSSNSESIDRSVFTFQPGVATFIGVSIQDLKPNSQDTSAFYLANIYQILADVNVTLPPALATPPQFSPTSSAIWVNSRYLWVTQPPCTPHRRSRLRSYFAEGVDKSRLPWATEVLPALLHCSLLLFFVGLVVFLFNIHHTVFTVVLSWVGLCASIVYACTSFMPIIRQDSPYYMPLTWFPWYIVNSFKELYLRRLLKGVIRAAEETAQGLGSAIDGRALLWALESL